MSTSQGIWSPSQAVANTARESLAWIVSNRLALVPEDRHIEVMTLASQLDNLIAKFEKEGKAERIVALEAELAQVCEDGEKAEQEFVNAKNKELIVRNADNKRLERYNAATKALDKLKNEPLPTFHTNKHITRKIERIADAQAEIDAALADMSAHPLAIPTVVQAKQQAEYRVNELAARARGLRRELASLKGEDAHTTGQQRSSVGLVG
jgi:exoribonuclease R